MSRAILFRCHFLNAIIIDVFRHIQQDCPNDDVILLYDATRYPIRSDSPKVFIFSEQEISQSGYPFFNEQNLREKQISPLWYFSDYPLLFFHRQRPEYDSYWLVEYDVRFTGNWRMLFDQAPEGDLVGTHVARYVSSRDWVWWRQKDVLGVEDRLRVKCFFPLLRFSNRALDLVDFHRTHGMSGYCEMAVPTLLSVSGYTIRDIGGDGEFALPAWKNCFYSPETFNDQPRQTAERAAEWLYHPVRESTEVTQDQVLRAGEIEIECWRSGSVHA